MRQDTEACLKPQGSKHFPKFKPLEKMNRGKNGKDLTKTRKVKAYMPFTLL